MNLPKLIKQLYFDLFSWAIESENDLDRTFLEFEDFHAKCLPESENAIERLYAKIFKSMWFKLAAPLVFTFLKFQLMKYTSQEYLQKLIEKQVDEM